MKRDLDLVRKIVVEMQDMPPGYILTSMDNVDDRLFAEHIILMKEAGFLDAFVQHYQSGEAPKVQVTRLTWDGQNFADLIASDTIWNKVKAKVIKPGVSWTFGIFTELLKQEAAKSFTSLS